LNEAFALRDLKVHVLDGMGHGAHGARRLGAALRRLAGPAALLTAQLDGLDAAELMTLGAPEAGYQVVYEPEEVPAAAARRAEALHAELGSKKMSDLRRQASAVASTRQLDAADDSDSPKAALIELIISHEGRA
jgi:hypothetical protein